MLLICVLYDVGAVKYCNNDSCDTILINGAALGEWPLVTTNPDDERQAAVVPGGFAFATFMSTLIAIGLAVEVADQGRAVYKWARALLSPPPPTPHDAPLASESSKSV